MKSDNKKTGILLAFAGCMLIVQPLMAAEEIKGNLVDVRWLEKNLKNVDILIIDASPAQIYKTKHIPGAINVDTYSWYGLRDMPVGEMEKLFQSWGISSGKKIVMYDQGGTIFATRLFYSLYYYGFPVKDLVILDGGLFRWQEEGLPVTTDIAVVPQKGTFKIDILKEDVKVELPEFLTASGNPVDNVLLEALGADWHFGEVLAFNKAGHIPYAIVMPSDDFYNPDKTFKSAEELERMTTYLGIRPEQQIYTHCGGGVAASVPFFAFKFLLNYPNVKLYKESQFGWLSDERELPYWTYDAPFLMRETSWLQFWGGQMIRRFGGANVSIVDVRPAEAFNLGHVPLALNVPADMFKNNIVNPDKLAELLSSAGLNASHEAVVISGKGLTKDAALAFIMLEKLGQYKVSVFMDSLDKWTQSGFALTKDNDLSVPTLTYPVSFRKEIIISDPLSTHGLYPKIFIASGKNVPVKAQEGKLVHIPYTDLLNTDGTPKAAKDLWNILLNAGVPRYAEIICFSDDAGEAAVNYYILKLMGYPDIKVLVI